MYIYIYTYINTYIHVYTYIMMHIYIWQDGFKLRDYLKAESDIRLLGDKIAKMNTFLPAL